MKTTPFFSLLTLFSLTALSPDLQAQGRLTWNPQTRGTIIGAGVGGTAGAIIHKKNPVVGAVIGGAVGAVAGNQVGKKQRRPWSPQAKGAVIGTGVGAAAGAIINKRNRVVGGVIGGVIGGVGGYAVGKHIDNRNKKRAAEAAARAEAERVAAERTKATEPDFQGSSPALLPVQRPKATATALVAYQPAPALVQEVNETPFGYLPNPNYGDPTAAYPLTEFRQKSW
ncbi:MAG: glycine zipper 2TM domain-containing protein [Sphingobacteriaceae bacterium]|nr:glycine zipper 2TM domain-containing protein [Cytophagaceae bacterium]